MAAPIQYGQLTRVLERGGRGVELGLVLLTIQKIDLLHSRLRHAMLHPS